MCSCAPPLPYPPSHAHFFSLTSTETLRHHHLLRIYTFPVNGAADDGHVHQYLGITGIKYGHYHNYHGTTGPAIPLPNGAHYHLVEGIVDQNLYNTPRANALETSKRKEGFIRELHQHAYSGATGPGIAYDLF